MTEQRKIEKFGVGIFNPDSHPPEFSFFKKKCISKVMEKERDYDNDGLDPSEEYFRKKKIGFDDDDTYFPQEESEPPHY